MTVLAASGLQLAFGSTRALDGVDITVDAGEVVAVMGASGSGKSSLLHCLAGILRPDAGCVWLAGERIDNLSDRERSALRRTHFGFVFQFGELVSELTVLENVGLPLRLLGLSRPNANRRALQALERLGIGEVAGKLPVEVSGGQAQRAAVARALVHSPRVVFADEPTGALDTINGELVLDALTGLAREQGSAVLLVTHETPVAAHAAREVILRDGRVAVSDRAPSR